MKFSRKENNFFSRKGAVFSRTKKKNTLLKMMFEGPLFNPEDFTGGKRGQGPNLSIAAFKKWREEKLEQWMYIAEEELSEHKSENKKKIKVALQSYHEWEDLKHHHLAFISRVLGIEFYIRTSENKKWIIIRPEDSWPELSIQSSPMVHGTRVFIENLQETGGWHYNLVTFPNLGIGCLTEAQVEENLRVLLSGGQTFGDIVWPEEKKKKLTWANICKSIEKAQENRIELSTDCQADMKSTGELRVTKSILSIRDSNKPQFLKKNNKQENADRVTNLSFSKKPI